MDETLFYDERDWEPGGAYFEGPIDVIDDDDYADESRVEPDGEGEDGPPVRRAVYQAPPRRRVREMTSEARAARYIDDEL